MFINTKKQYRNSNTGLPQVPRWTADSRIYQCILIIYQLHINGMLHALYLYVRSRMHIRMQVPSYVQYNWGIMTGSTAVSVTKELPGLRKYHIHSDFNVHGSWYLYKHILSIEAGGMAARRSGLNEWFTGRTGAPRGPAPPFYFTHHVLTAYA